MTSTSTTPRGSGADKAIIWKDGTLFVYKPSGVSAWSNNSGGNWYSKLLVQNDGNVVIYNASNQAVWSTGTCCR